MAISDIKRTSPSELIKKHGRASSAPANIAMVQEVVEEANTDIAAAGTALETAIGDDLTSTEILSNDNDVNENLSIVDEAIDTLNKRDLHTVSSTNIIKHKLLALGTYDFDIHGTDTTAIDITSVDVLPDNAIITNVYFDITTDLASASGTTTMAFQIEEGGGTAITTAGSIVADGSNAGVFEEGTISFPIKLTEASKLQVIQTVADVTAGVATVYVEYVGGTWSEM